MFAAIKERLETPRIVVRDELWATPAMPYYLVQIRPLPPEGRRLTFDADTLPSTALILAVNNSSAGRDFLAARAISLLDNWRIGGRVVEVTYTGPPIAEDEGHGDYRWSQTIEARVYLPKEYP